MEKANRITVSIIVPVYNGGRAFVDCLNAIKRFKPRRWELIVVDDGSTDNSKEVALNAGATVHSTRGRLGPGAARNIGAQYASGDFVLFIDADCEVNEFTFHNVAEEIAEYPEVDAIFGSYDDSPRAANFIAQYKNLMHRYVHQTGNEQANTFWAGCGLVRRVVFLDAGGFNTHRFKKPSIEDIELGYRLRQRGARIRLAKSVQVKHYKAWDFWGLIKVDVMDRGLPWTRLLLANESCRANDLNLNVSQQVSVVSAFLLIGSLLLGLLHSPLICITPACVLTLLLLNRDAYSFFYQHRGLLFMLRVIPMHWLYFLYAGASFALGTWLHYWDTAHGRQPYALHPIPRIRSHLLVGGSTTQR